MAKKYKKRVAQQYRMKFVSDDDLRKKTRTLIKEGQKKWGPKHHKSIRALARHWNVSQSFLSQWLNGIRPFANEVILKNLGYDKEPHYRRSKHFDIWYKPTK